MTIGELLKEKKIDVSKFKTRENESKSKNSIFRNPDFRNISIKEDNFLCRKLSDFLIKKFLKQKIGYIYLITDLEYEYHSTIDDIVLENALKYANNSLSDRMILYLNKKNALKSIIKRTNKQISKDKKWESYDKNDERNSFLSNETYNVIDEFSETLRKKFLEEKVGFSCSVEYMEKMINKKYNIEIDKNELEKAIIDANNKLIDIKIVYDTDGCFLKSEFQFEGKGSHNYSGSEVECPICKGTFNTESIKQHILEAHTSLSDYYSILQKKKTAKNTYVFYCHHCKKYPNFFGEHINPRAILFHIQGSCMNANFHKKVKESNTKRIWKGYAYSNNESVLGNSGQILPDIYGYGSFPIEDNYGDGDSSF